MSEWCSVPMQSLGQRGLIGTLAGLTILVGWLGQGIPSESAELGKTRVNFKESMWKRLLIQNRSWGVSRVRTKPMMKHLMPFLDGVDVTRPEIRCNWGIVMQLKIVQIIVQSPGLDWMVVVGPPLVLDGAPSCAQLEIMTLSHLRGQFQIKTPFTGTLNGTFKIRHSSDRSLKIRSIWCSVLGVLGDSPTYDRGVL